MLLKRAHLTALLNALYDADKRRVTVSHPCSEVGELLRFDLADPFESPVRFTQSVPEYEEIREAIGLEYGDAAKDDLPNGSDYTRLLVAGGVLDVNNRDEVETFLGRHGYPDLKAGHSPVVAGIDANVMPWRLGDALGFDPQEIDLGDGERAPTNGYALATGVKQELDWHYKHFDTYSLANAFGVEFERLSDQPAGANRQGFLGLYEYRRLMANRRVDVVESGTGDEAIIEGYRRYADDGRTRLLLFSNDYGYVENALDAGLRAQHVEIPVDLPRKVTASWWSIENALYYLAVIFGVLELPKVTLYGVWNGKSGRDWQNETLDVDPRSPKIESTLQRDRSIIE